MQKAFVTGCAGFIGSTLVDRLLHEGVAVVGWDNFSTGQERFLENAQVSPLFSLVRGDNLDLPGLTAAMKGCDIVFHLAANADVRFGTDHTRRDLEQNTIATYNVLEAMRLQGVKRIAFSSTGSTYGEADVIPTPETAPFPVQTSLYGASKVAGEGLIAAFCEGFGFEGYIFRFVSILGERYTHGHIFDFYQQLTPSRCGSSVTASSARATSMSRIASTPSSTSCAIKPRWQPSTARKFITWARRSTFRSTTVSVTSAMPSACSPSWNIPVATAGGSATTPSSFSIPRKSERPAGRRS
jgi:UDP-glucose 4-epimerase